MGVQKALEVFAHDYDCIFWGIFSLGPYPNGLVRVFLAPFFFLYNDLQLSCTFEQKKVSCENTCLVAYSTQSFEISCQPSGH